MTVARRECLRVRDDYSPAVLEAGDPFGAVTLILSPSNSFWYRVEYANETNDILAIQRKKTGVWLMRKPEKATRTYKNEGNRHSRNGVANTATPQLKAFGDGGGWAKQQWKSKGM